MSEKVAKEDPGSSQACGEGKVDIEEAVSRSKTDSGGDSLEGLLCTLKQQIKDSNWLEVNTPERWERENPELATEYKKVKENSAPSSNT